MSSPPDLASLLAHEIEPSLLALEIRLERLLSVDGCREEARSCLAEVSALRSLVEDFRLLGDHEVRVEAFPLAPILGALARRFGPIAGSRNVALRFSPAEGASMTGDARASERVLSNLVDNAVKFSPAGGEVRVEVRQDEGEVRVQVEDRGAGIAEEHQERIFDPFVRLDREKPGSGLGLSIALALAKAQGGKLSLSSAPGRGSRFTFALPRA